MSYALSHSEPGGSAPAVLSLLVHALLFTVLFFGLRWQSRHPDTVVVELWSQLPELEQAPPVAATPPEIKPEPKSEPKPEPARDLKMETKLAATPKAEAAQPKKPDIAVEREKKSPKKKIEKNEKKREAPLKLNEDQRISDQLAQEVRALSQSAQPKNATKAVIPSAPAAPAIDAAYAEKIRGKIKGYIHLPPDIVGNPEAIFDVQMFPNGDVSIIQLRQSSGHKLYDEALERAIRNSSPLPLPERREQFQRRLELKFKPKD